MVERLRAARLVPAKRDLGALLLLGGERELSSICRWLAFESLFAWLVSPTDRVGLKHLAKSNRGYLEQQIGGLGLFQKLVKFRPT